MVGDTASAHSPAEVEDFCLENGDAEVLQGLFRSLRLMMQMQLRRELVCRARTPGRQSVRPPAATTSGVLVTETVAAGPGGRRGGGSGLLRHHLDALAARTLQRAGGSGPTRRGDEHNISLAESTGGGE